MFKRLFIEYSKEKMHFKSLIFFLHFFQEHIYKFSTNFCF